MHKINRIGCMIALCMLNCFVFAQQMNTTKEDPTDFMRSNGKIYVVMTVVVVIVLGLFIYLFNLDRKMRRLEKENTSTLLDENATSLRGGTTKQSAD